MSIDKYILGGGLLAIGMTVFAESGLLIGFFLPGDTLLFGAGILAAQGVFPIQWLILTIVVAAIAGDNVGYSIGQRYGPRLFKRKDGIIFRQEYLGRAEKFYEKHGGKTVILARFVPVIRTFAPVVAGIGSMSRKRFFVYNVIGGILWGTSLPLAGYYVGSKLPWLEGYIEPAIIAVVVLSIGPAMVHLLRNKSFRAEVKKKLVNGYRKITLNT